MDKDIVLKALQEAKQNSPKRKFNQSVDLIINLKGLDLKKPEHQVNLFVPLRYGRGKKIKICALVGPEAVSAAKKVCDDAISSEDFGKYDKKKAKKLAKQFDFFIAHAPIMAKIAAAFGPILGPRGKMPNPKAGCVVPPNASLAPVCERLQNLIRVVTKNDPLVQCMVGKDDSKEDEVADNLMTIYNAVLHTLPNEETNIKSVFVKLTMGKPVQIGSKEEAPEEKPKKISKKSAKEKPKKAAPEEKIEENKETVEEKPAKKEAEPKEKESPKKKGKKK